MIHFRATPVFESDLGLVTPVAPSFKSRHAQELLALLYSIRIGVPDRSGIRAGLPVGKPFYWSTLSLVFEKTIYNLKMSYENLLRILFTPYLVSLHL